MDNDASDRIERITEDLQSVERYLATIVPNDIMVRAKLAEYLAFLDARPIEKPRADLPKDAPLPEGWYRYMGGKPIHSDSLLAIRFFMMKDRLAFYKTNTAVAAEAASGHNLKTRPTIDGARPRRDYLGTYTPKMDEAYYLVVQEGRNLTEAATLLNLPYSLVSAWARSYNWLNKRIKNEELIVRRTGTEEAQERAKILKTMLLESVDKAKSRLAKLEQAIDRKWDIALGDTEEVTFDDAAGKRHTLRQARASEARLTALLELNGRLLKQLDELNRIGGSKLLGEASRMKRGVQLRRNKADRKSHELMAQARPPLKGDV